MEKCYEYFACSKTDCTMHNNKKQNCWEIANTLSNSPYTAFLKSTLKSRGVDPCTYCTYKTCATSHIKNKTTHRHE